jgi:5-carboxymethyl-2-hydroxymuconate isomerase
MPHIIIEHSNNLKIERKIFEDFLVAIHQGLAAMGEFKIEDIKSRVYSSDLFLVGAPGVERGFVHCSLIIFPGRSAETKKTASQLILNQLQQHFENHFSNHPIELTVEVREIERESYSKLSL